MDKVQWDERYKAPAYAYGREANVYFKQVLDTLKPGAIFLPADGEGRNGVYAASQGWTVTACDLSHEGRLKALQLAEKANVRINYTVGDLEELSFEQESFDVIALLYAHFAAEKKAKLHRQIIQYLKPGGVIIMEAFGKRHLEIRKDQPNVGGPNDLDSLFSTAEISADFAGFKIAWLEEKVVPLSEGVYHRGNGSVVRFVGVKP